VPVHAAQRFNLLKNGALIINNVVIIPRSCKEIMRKI
jgi:hypothetical protein